MATTAGPDLQSTLAARFISVRRRSLELCAGLTPEDMMVQSSPDASPAKWHLAHTAWFFESFVLVPFLPGYRLFNRDFPWLFNSYYEGFSAFPEKKLRASFSRPALEEILRYRDHVDRDLERLLQSNADAEALRRIELGVNHEEQHQELLLTDIKHAFFTNPLRPVYKQPSPASEIAASVASPLSFLTFPGGLRDVGHSGNGFCFDNELKRHRVWLEPFQFAGRLVTCAEFAAFMADGGYTKPERIREMMALVFEMFPRIEERLSQKAKTLSGGERQMLCIGRALMSSPKLILFDEPSLGLQPSIVLQIFEHITRIHEKGVAILLVEQNVFQTLAITERTYVLEHGRIALEGRSDKLINDDYIKKSYLAI